MSRMTDVGSWMLTRLARGPYMDAVAGDLMEGVRAGRSAGWYWRQVIVAIGAAWMAEVKARRGALLFSVLWTGSFLMGWYFPVHRMLQDRITGAMLNAISLPFPFSMLLGLLYEELLDIGFIWIGLLVYLTISRRWRDTSAMRVLGGWMMSLCTCVLGKLLLRVVMMDAMAGWSQDFRANFNFAWMLLLWAVSLYCAIMVAMPARRELPVMPESAA